MKTESVLIRCISVLFRATNRGDDRGMDLEPEPILAGRLGQYDTPDWTPLEHLGRDRYRRMRRTDAVGFVLDTWWLVHRPELIATVRDALEAVQAADVADDSTRILPASPAAALRCVP